LYYVPSPNDSTPVTGRQSRLVNGTKMRSLTEMTPDELHVAHDATAALLRFREYAPPGGLLVMLAGKVPR
jgi:hypothetical protein